MGDRTWWTETCPKCKKETVEVYDALSSMMFSRVCKKCGWTDGLRYFEGKDNIIELCTETQARERGLIMDCPFCKETMTWWEKERLGLGFSIVWTPHLSEELENELERIEKQEQEEVSEHHILEQALANEQLDKMFIRIDGELISIKEVIKRIVEER